MRVRPAFQRALASNRADFKQSESV